MLNTLPVDYPNRILCFYHNATSQIQVVRIDSIPGWYFEKIVFPGQRIFFESQPEALFELYMGEGDRAVLLRDLPCRHLQVPQEDAPAQPPAMAIA